MSMCAWNCTCILWLRCVHLGMFWKYERAVIDQMAVLLVQDENDCSMPHSKLGTSAWLGFASLAAVISDWFFATTKNPFFTFDSLCCCCLLAIWLSLSTRLVVNEWKNYHSLWDLPFFIVNLQISSSFLARCSSPILSASKLTFQKSTETKPKTFQCGKKKTVRCAPCKRKKERKRKHTK